MSRAILPILMLPLLVAACSKGDQASGPPGKGGAGMGGMPPPEVEVMTVTRANVPRTAEAPGRLHAVRSAEVRARVEGILEKREFTEGSEVKAGQVLFRIDARPLAAAQDSAKAALARAQAAALIASQNLDRLQPLKDTPAISRLEYDQAVAAKAQAEAEVAAARATLKRAEIDLGYATVTAPIDGRISRARVTEGALVGKGEATPLVTIEQYTPIWVDFSQSSADFLAIRANRGKAAPGAVRLLLENGQPYPLPGRLLFSDLAVDPATGSVGLRAEFPNPERALLPGQFVTVRLPVAQADNVVVVPQRAVQGGTQGQVVMAVAPDGKVMPLPVKTGGLSGANWIISEGLQGGEQIIVNGLQKARPGMTVKPVVAGGK